MEQQENNDLKENLQVTHILLKQLFFLDFPLFKSKILYLKSPYNQIQISLKLFYL